MIYLLQTVPVNSADNTNGVDIERGLPNLFDIPIRPR